MNFIEFCITFRSTIAPSKFYSHVCSIHSTLINSQTHSHFGTHTHSLHHTYNIQHFKRHFHSFLCRSPSASFSHSQTNREIMEIRDERATKGHQLIRCKPTFCWIKFPFCSAKRVSHASKSPQSAQILNANEFSGFVKNCLWNEFVDGHHHGITTFKHRTVEYSISSSYRLLLWHFHCCSHPKSVMHERARARARPTPLAYPP